MSEPTPQDDATRRDAWLAKLSPPPPGTEPPFHGYTIPVRPPQDDGIHRAFVTALRRSSDADNQAFFDRMILKPADAPESPVLTVQRGSAVGKSLVPRGYRIYPQPPLRTWYWVEWQGPDGEVTHMRVSNATYRAMLAASLAAAVTRRLTTGGTDAR